MKTMAAVCFALLASVFGYANDKKDSLAIKLEQYAKFIDSVNKVLKFQTGTIQLPNGIARLNIPAGFKYLNTEQTSFVITELWGNPPDKDILGMIFPEKGGPFADSSYAFVVSYEALGYVKDEDADKIDYDELLKQIQTEEAKENTERQRLGYSTVHMVGWAQKPYYDKTNKILHWAKELKFGSESEVNTLNYDVRILGRKGILSLNAVGTMNELELVKKDINQVLHMAQFTEGNKYADFDSNVDQVAAWTIGGLVAGKILAKVGILAGLGKILVAAWKFILIGLVAIGGAIGKIFKRKKDNEVAEGY